MSKLSERPEETPSEVDDELLESDEKRRERERHN